MKVVRGMSMAIGENDSSPPSFQIKQLRADRCPTCHGSWITDARVDKEQTEIDWVTRDAGRRTVWFVEAILSG